MSWDDGVPLMNMRGIDDNLRGSRRVSKTAGSVLGNRPTRTLVSLLRGIPPRCKSPWKSAKISR